MRGVELVGPSGVGKTAIKRALVRHHSFHDAAADEEPDHDFFNPVEIPALRRMIEQYPSEINRLRWHTYADRRLTFRERLDKGKPFVLDDCIIQLTLAMMSRQRHPWMRLVGAVDIMRKIQMPDLLVLIACDPGTAMQRQKQRGRVVSYDTNYYLKKTTAQAVIRLACLLYRQPVFHIDTSHVDTARAAAAITSAWSRQAS